MSKKHRKPSTEIPQVGNALEVPNYVIPMTDLEYKETTETPLDLCSDCTNAEQRPSEDDAQ